MRIDQRKKPAPKPGGQDFLNQAFADLKKETAVADRKRKKKNKGATRDIRDTIKAALIVVGLLLAGLLGDGLRRESAEFHAEIKALVGSVQQIADDGSAEALADDAELGDGDVIQTAANSTVTLTFPDGSAVTVEPNTTFEVRLLGYSRDGKRERSFMVREGSALSHVTQLFGGEIGSEATVCTPTAVAAVRGTAFRVSHDAASQTSAVQVLEGNVATSTPLGEQPTGVGQAVVASGYTMAAPVPLDAAARQQLQQTTSAMRTLEEQPSFVVSVERKLLRIGDPVLQLIGLAPGAWGYDSIDSARRAACMEALRRLRTHIEGLSEVPPYLNRVTLVELNLDDREQKRLRSGFANGMIDSYQRLQGDGYVVRARARDRARTVYQMTNADLVVVE